VDAPPSPPDGGSTIVASPMFVPALPPTAPEPGAESEGELDEQASTAALSKSPVQIQPTARTRLFISAERRFG
jgi:hypothetical protein